MQATKSAFLMQVLQQCNNTPVTNLAGMIFVAAKIQALESNFRAAHAAGEKAKREDEDRRRMAPAPHDPGAVSMQTASSNDRARRVPMILTAPTARTKSKASGATAFCMSASAT